MREASGSAFSPSPYRETTVSHLGDQARSEKGCSENSEATGSAHSRLRSKNPEPVGSATQGQALVVWWGRDCQLTQEVGGLHQAFSVSRNRLLASKPCKMPESHKTRKTKCTVNAARVPGLPGKCRLEPGPRWAERGHKAMGILGTPLCHRPVPASTSACAWGLIGSEWLSSSLLLGCLQLASRS